MISKSDLVILVVASSALAVGIYRWHQNTTDVSAITIPASANTSISSTVDSNASSTEQIVEGSTRVIDGSAIAATQLSNGNNQVIVQTIPEQPPVSGIVVTSSAESTESVQLGSHTVRSGDYLGKIANQYGTDVDTLRDLNGINGSIIQIGQQILYPL